jgi:hypothetical protein
MEEDNPITRHLKLQLSLIMTSFYLFRLCKSRTHTRVRHISFNHNVRPSHWFTGGIGQLENNRSRTDSDWFRRDLMLNRDKR